MTRRGGFTLVELLVFMGIFTTVVLAFISIFVSVTRIHVRELAAVEVNTQSQFLLQTIQYYVERSSLIEMSADATTSTLTLRMSATAEDPTTIYLSDGQVYLRKTAGGTPEPLTSPQIEVVSLNFTKRANAPARDSVAVTFSMEYAGDNPDRQFRRSLRTGIARVSAAVFDSDVVPNSAGDKQLGTSSSNWQSVNQTLYFSGSNVGIGTASPLSKLQVSGGDIYVDTSGRGIILKDGSGGCWKTTASSTGALVTESFTCP